MKIEEIVKIYYVIRNLTNIYNSNDKNHYKKEYDYVCNELSLGNCIAQPEYKFICWLNFNDDQLFPIPVNKPHIPEIIGISINDFIDTFCVNTHKLNLFKKLISFLEFKNSVFNCQYFDLLIGGSYTDQTNTLPGDIDCAILLDKELISFFHVDCDPRENKDKELDIEFLDSNLSYKHYSTFVWITMLGNLPEISDKENVDCIMNNTFKKRNIYKVRFSMSSQT